MSFEMPMMWINKEKVKKPEEELEKIGLAASKLKEKYGEYESMKAFIDYLAGVERIFALAKIEKWKAGEIKKSFIEAESYLMALDSAIDEDIFNRIKDDFQAAYQALDLIRSVAAKLIAEHSQCKDCVEFIEYMRDSLISLSDVTDLNIDEKKEQILRAKMVLVCSDGEPDIKELEKIYVNFKDLLKEK